MAWTLAISSVFSFAITILITPYFIRFFKKTNVLAIDQQKTGKPILPTSGGMPVLFGFLTGVLLYTAITTLLTASAKPNLTLLMAATLSTVIIALVGFFDDLYTRQEKKVNASDSLEYREGLRQWLKPILTLPAAVPIMAVLAGTTYMAFPLFGHVEFGILYPLLLIPIAVVCVSNATNMLAGLNGLEAGMNGVALATLGVFAFSHGSIEGAVIALAAAFALFAFLFFNWYPARLLPGDSFTYFAGGAFVSAVIIGNIEKFGIIIFAPWILEAFLKLRGRFKVRSYGDLQKDGTIKAPYDKIYSLTHVAMKLPHWFGRKKGFTEKQVAGVLILFEILLCASALLFYTYVT
ncbi:MAG: hypothetical protein V1811_01275 [Candidatus Micrarchaeota archaeon]